MNNGGDEKVPKRAAPLAGMHPAVFILIALITVFITYQIFGGIISYFVLGDDLSFEGSNLNFSRIIISFSQYMFILTPALILNMLQGSGFKSSFRLNAPDLKVLLLSVAGIIVVQPFLQAYVYVQNQALLSIPFGSDVVNQIKQLMDTLESAVTKLVMSYSVPELVFVLFVVALTPSICEEFLFRGIILSNFEKILSVQSSLFITGLIFAAFHFHPFNLIPLILLGYFLSYTAYYSGSIYTSILIHFLNNAFSTVMIFRYGKETLDNPAGSFSENLPLIFAGLASLFIFLLILLIIKRISPFKPNTDKFE